MKNNIKIILAFIVGGLVFGSIGTVLALTYKASDIVYSPSDTSWNVNTVGEAINSLALSKTSDNYSTEEQVVGTWIDGKPIYQKTLTGIWPVAASSNIEVGVIQDIDNYLDGQASGYVTGAINEKRLAASHMAHIYVNTSTNKVAISSFYAVTWTAVTIKYTKTTDTATN